MSGGSKHLDEFLDTLDSKDYPQDQIPSSCGIRTGFGP